MLAMSTVADILIMGTFQTVLVGIIESVMGNSFWETLTAFDCNEGGRLRQAWDQARNKSLGNISASSLHQKVERSSSSLERPRC